MMRPRGRPPIPSARSSASEPGEPGPTLAAVDAELLQPLVEIAREQSRAVLFVLEHEHADAARLAVASGREPDLGRARGSVAQRADDRPELSGRAVAEKGERDV